MVTNLLANTDFLPILINILDEGVVIHDQTGAIKAFNDQACSILELSKEQLLGKTSFDDDWKAIKEDGSSFPGEEHPSIKTLHSGLPENNVIMGISTATKDTKWLSINSKGFNWNGEKFVFVSFYDVSNQINQNKRLENSKQNLELLLQSIDDIIFELDQDGTFIHFLSFNESVLAESKEKFLGKTVKEVFPEEFATQLSELIRKVVKENYPVEIEVKWPFPSKEEIWRKIKVQPVKGGSGKVILLIADLTEEKLIEDRLRQSEEKIINAFQYSPTGFLITRLNGEIQEANLALCDMLGYFREEVNGLSVTNITFKEDRDLDKYKKAQLLKREIEFYEQEKRLIHKKGRIIWVQTSNSIVWNSDGTPKCFICTVLNISSLKNLIWDLESKNNVLQTTLTDLELKMNQLEDFNRIIAHNVRGPLRNQVALFELYEKAETEGQRSEILQILKRSSLSVINTLEELIEVIQIRLNKGIQKDTCHIPTILEKIKSQLFSDIIEKRAVFFTTYEFETIKFPKAYFESIIYNLISNALKYAKPDIPAVIKISTGRINDRTYFSIEDNGLGIDLERYGKDMFKLNKTFHRGFDSKGIGLYITKNQIDAMGATINVESMPGKGTTFTIYLP